MITLDKLAEQQKNQRAERIKSRILKQTHDKKLAESFTSITEKIEKSDESTQQQGETFRKPDSQVENTQTPAIHLLGSTQPFCDTLTLIKRNKTFPKLIEKPNSDVFWTGV